MNAIRYVNPFSARHQALKDFNKLTGIQKATTIFVTTLISILTLMFATTPVFRALVGRFKAIDIKKPFVSPVTLPQRRVAEKTHKLMAELLSPFLPKVEEKNQTRDDGHQEIGDFNINTDDDLQADTDKNEDQSIDSTQKVENTNESDDQEVDLSDLSLIFNFEEDDINLFNQELMALKEDTQTTTDQKLGILKAVTTLNSSCHEATFGSESLTHTDDKIESALMDSITSLESIIDLESITTDSQNVSQTPPLTVGDKDLSKSIIVIDVDDSKESDEHKLDATTLQKLTSPNHIGAVFVETNSQTIKAPTDSWVAIGNVKELEERLCHSERKQEFKGSYNLVGQFYSLINASSEEIGDETVLTFDSDGKLCTQEECPDGMSPESTVGTFFQMIKETYGPVLGKRIINRYFRNSSARVTLTEVTYKDLKRAFIGAAANVRRSDLKKLFQQIHKDFKTNLPIRCGELLSDTMIDSIKQRDEFDELSSEQIAILKSAYSILPGKGGQFQSTLGLLFEGANIEESSTTFDPLAHDLVTLLDLGDIKLIDKQTMKHSLSEHIGKKIVYRELQRGMIIPLLNKSGEECQYYVNDHLEHKGDAVIANLITPVNQENHFSTSTAEKDIFLTFRGTHPDPAGKDAGASIHRDVDSSGVGRKDFNERSEEILQMLEYYLIHSDDTLISLNISGHSLGGCDTQRALLLISKKISESAPNSPWRKIKHIDVNTHNSPRLEDDTATEFVNVIKELDRMAEDEELDLGIDLTHIRIFDKDSEDFIQTLWYKLLGAEIRDSKIFKKKIIKVQFNQSLSAGGKHSAKAFMTTSASHTKTIIDDNTADDLLQKELCQRYYWKDDENTTGWEKLTQSFLWAVSYLHTSPVTLAQCVLYKGKFFAAILNITRFLFGTRSSPRAVVKGYLEGKQSSPKRKRLEHWQKDLTGIL